MNNKALKVLTAMCLWLLLVTAALCAYGWQWLHEKRVMFVNDSSYQVNSGASLHFVARDMRAKGIIHWPEIWLLYAKFTNQSNIKAGEYIFERIESPVSILKKINDGKVTQYSITFIEGTRFKDFLAKLHSHEKIRNTLNKDNIIEQLNAAGIDIDHVEGWFYPDTFQFSAGDTDISLLLRAHKKMKHVLLQEWQKKDKDLPYKSAYEALIMASIVEKETGAKHERAQIAGVFTRRLEKRMRLQTDPTVIYGMGDRYDGNIRRRDLRARTPYNTYVIKGLPPTPIAMPGRAAIVASLHPEPGETLYFVAKGDGSHHFSKSLDEHNRAVAKYQKKRRKNYRSAPAVSQDKQEDRR
ncbi:endolytic transglycosylase MltG [Agarilytica rhodophyticola]|uniref:endolytic transglycosylase MltG n=1 Tax=Agarilytica rhodophyticola TaxID=1737490 RepID=UPI000B345271|nr:endolytic transglycosylase MltG [Agarilytica rhodophyticola]